MMEKTRTRKAPGNSRVRIPMIIRDIALAILAAISFTIGATLAIIFFRRYGGFLF